MKIEGMEGKRVPQSPTPKQQQERDPYQGLVEEAVKSAYDKGIDPETLRKITEIFHKILQGKPESKTLKKNRLM